MITGHFLMTQIPKAQTTRETSFGFLIQTLARKFDGLMKTELKKVDVDGKLFAGLMMLMEQDGISQRQLGKRLNFPEYFTSRNIDALVQAGFVERRPDPDSRRSFLICLTDAGRTKAKTLPEVVRRVNAEVLADFSKSEQTQVIDLLQKAARVGDYAAE